MRIRFAWLLAGTVSATTLTAVEAAAQNTQSMSTTRTETLTVVTAPTIQVNTFETRLTGRIGGGMLLFDQRYAEPFGGGGPRAGIVQARAAITNAGAPGLVIGAPMLVSRSESVTPSTTARQSVVTSEQFFVETTIGPGTVAAGDRGLCQTPGTVTTAPSNCSRPQGTTPFTIGFGATNTNVNTNTHSAITETRTTTETRHLFEHWELVGQQGGPAAVQPIGVVHTAVQSGALDAGSRFLRRMGEDLGASATGAGIVPNSPPAREPGRLRMWAEGYGVWSRTKAESGRPGDERQQYGFAAGLSGHVTQSLSLGIGVDHGNTDIKLDSGLERGDIRLTQLGLYTGYNVGSFFANLAGTVGFGEAKTRHELGGLTQACYGLTTGGVFGEVGYRLKWGVWRLTPSIGADYTLARSDGFRETGTAPLVAPAHTADRTRVWAGLDLGQRLGPFDWSVYGRLVGVVSGEERLLPVAFLGTPARVRGLAEGTLGGDAGARAVFRVGVNAELFARYDGRFRDGFTAHAATAGLKVLF